MTDPWQPPDRPGYDAVPGWGPPPVPPPARNPWIVPLAVVIALALGLAVGAVAFRPGKVRPVAAPTSSPPAAPAPTPTVHRAPVKPRATRPPSPRPQAVRTYSAPPEGIPVSGRVVDANGRAVSGATVTLQRHEGFFEGFARGLTAAFSLGLACLTDICTVPYGVARTDGSGAYTVFLEPDVDDYDLTVQPGYGATFETRIDFASKALRLPEVVMWNPAPTVEQSGTRVRVRFRTPPARLGPWRDASATVSDRQQRPLVSMQRLRSGDSFDGRLIGDVRGRVDVVVRVRSKLGDATYRASTPISGHHRPVSRGMPCYEYGASGRPVRNSPCPLTNGDLLTEWHPKVPDPKCSGGGDSCDRKVMVDLGSARRLRYVLVRRCDDFFDQVESSADGKTWQVLIEQHSGEGGDISDVCAREIDVVARYVRVIGPQGGFYTRRAEISLF